MKLGIDFGTTHTIVSLVDRGNYPVISFNTPDGDYSEVYPSLVAVCGNQIKAGLEAKSVIDKPEWTSIRSLKSLLRTAKKEAFIEIKEKKYFIKDLFIFFLKQLKYDLIHNSNLEVSSDMMRASIAVPAQANSIQRFQTTEAFENAGFEVINMINEPSAAAIEYTHRYFKTAGKEKKQILVYDIGGGTFDISLAKISGRHHEVICTDGLEQLGGDQFDEVMANLIKEQVLSGNKLSLADENRLLERCRHEKERIRPQTRYIYFDGEYKSEHVEQRIPLKDYLEKCDPLINHTTDLVDQVFKQQGIDKVLKQGIVYLVGGMSNFPYISRRLKQNFGVKKVQRSPYPQAATAIGLAILMDETEGYSLNESMTRHFGLWREAEDGKSVSFDSIFEKHLSLPSLGEPPIVRRRRYSPIHNIGNFRFLECSHTSHGNPGGDMTFWDQIFFPFSPELEGKELKVEMVKRYENTANFEIEEIYTLNHQGKITVKLISHYNNYEKVYQLQMI